MSPESSNNEASLCEVKTLTNAKQFAVMTKWGMTPMQAVQAATVNAADLLGMTGKVGQVAPGSW